MLYIDGMFQIDVYSREEQQENDAKYYFKLFTCILLVPWGFVVFIFAWSIIVLDFLERRVKKKTEKMRTRSKQTLQLQKHLLMVFFFVALRFVQEWPDHTKFVCTFPNLSFRSSLFFLTHKQRFLLLSLASFSKKRDSCRSSSASSSWVGILPCR